ncbi:Fungal N-terminal domain-containing protein [Madurella fahalii]|uniref:Fungal N-terminal domain-containing protein n=1 Tax=Madurella fahalii TaxID=1157608 RepID=A0ABQ0GHL0_9PEZI
MASPVSIGDVIAMVKLAKTIAQAFTKGRKSAPAEFREVENQLYSLSTALAAFEDAHDSSGQLATLTATTQRNGGQTVAGMLNNCHETLKQLEKIVSKYGAITEEQDPGKSRIQRWSQELVRNYKKIAWTTEAGDLSTLRSQLMVHTNSLELILGILINSRTMKIEESVIASSKKLDDIHNWWTENLNSVTKPSKTESTELKTEPLLTSEVYVEKEELICQKATVVDDWEEKVTFQILRCTCKDTPHPRVESIALSPISFPLRQVGRVRTWTIFKATDYSTHRLVSIQLKNIPVQDMADFEWTFINKLAELMAEVMVKKHVSNMLVHPAPNAKHLRILDIKGELGDVHQSIETVTFAVGHRTLSKTEIDGISLLHYRKHGHEDEPRAHLRVNYAKILIEYGNTDPESKDITSSEIRLRRNSTIKTMAGIDVVVQAVESLGFVDDEETSRIEKTDVTSQMTTPESAERLYQQLEDMRMELFVLSLQYPRPDETVALHLQAAQIQCEEVCIADAELLITRDTKERSRLIILSRNRCTIVSQVLSESFFDAPGSQRRFTSPTWLVQLESPGVRKVYHYPKGFKFLSFNSNNAEKMFELGQDTILAIREK